MKLILPTKCTLFTSFEIISIDIFNRWNVEKTEKTDEQSDVSFVHAFFSFCEYSSRCDRLPVWLVKFWKVNIGRLNSSIGKIRFRTEMNLSHEIVSLSIKKCSVFFSVCLT